MTIEQIAIATLIPIATYGGVKVFAKVDRRIEKIRKFCYKLAELCEKAELDILESLFESVAIGDKSGVITAVKNLIKSLGPDKLWETLEKFFFNQLKYRLANRPEDEMKIVRLVDANRIAKDAELENQKRINADNAKRRKDENASGNIPLT